MESKYLEMTDITDNHNKFYKMIVQSNGNWTAEYGRVGSAGIKRVYPMSDFNKKYDEKIRKGYTDQTINHSTTSVANVNSSYDRKHKFNDILNSTIRGIVDKMLSWANKVIASNYTSSSISDEVTQDAVNEAQRLIDYLAAKSNSLSVSLFNDTLVKIFNTIPRRMVNVSDYVANKKSDYPEIISREQSLLDTVSGQVAKTPAAKVTKVLNTDAKDTILDAYGIEIRECSADETALVKSHMDPDAQRKFVRCFHVVNKETREKFDKYCKDEEVKKSEIKYYYHGSRNENYWNILIQGLKLHPNQKVQRAGTMFGYGLYFAPKATKSMGYTSLHGTYWAHGNNSNAMLMVYKVAMHKPFNLSQYSQSVSTWNEADCKKAGYGSVFAHAGISLRNDEAIVYNENACTISYLIETKD